MLVVSFISTSNFITNTLKFNTTIQKSISRNILQVRNIQLKDFSTSKYKSIDSPSCGGNPGQIIKIDCIVPALRSLSSCSLSRVILLDPSSKLFNQEDSFRLSNYEHLIFICGRYEGFDSRIYHYVDESLSIGSLTLTNGDLPALNFLDSIIRLIPCSVTNFASVIQDTFQKNIKIKQNKYTHPIQFEDFSIPQVLLNGNHSRIRKFNIYNSIKKSSLI